MSLHSFDPDIAKEVGVNAATIYQNIMFWTRKNLANSKHVHDGKVWTYNSVSALEELFPYLTPSQIRTAIKRLTDAEMIFEGNYNKSAYDRTKWYGVPCEMHLSKIANGSARNREPIPDIKPDIKPYTPPKPPKGGGDDVGFQGAYNPQKRGRRKRSESYDEVMSRCLRAASRRRLRQPDTFPSPPFTD